MFSMFSVHPLLCLFPCASFPVSLSASRSKCSNEILLSSSLSFDPAVVPGPVDMRRLVPPEVVCMMAVHNSCHVVSQLVPTLLVARGVPGEICRPRAVFRHLFTSGCHALDTTRLQRLADDVASASLVQSRHWGTRLPIEEHALNTLVSLTLSQALLFPIFFLSVGLSVVPVWNLAKRPNTQTPTTAPTTTSQRKCGLIRCTVFCPRFGLIHQSISRCRREVSSG